jgi:hypothetical protein
MVNFKEQLRNQLGFLERSCAAHPQLSFTKTATEFSAALLGARTPAGDQPDPDESGALHVGLSLCGYSPGSKLCLVS